MTERPFPNRTWPWRREDTNAEAEVARVQRCATHPHEVGDEIERLRADVAALEGRPAAWGGWGVERPGFMLFVIFGGDEAEAWKLALGWPTDTEIAQAKSHGARAFPIEIRERAA